MTLSTETSGSSSFTLVLFALLLLPGVLAFKLPSLDDINFETRRLGLGGAQRLAKRPQRVLYEGTPSPKNGTGGPASSDYPSDDDIRSNFTNPSGPFVFFAGMPFGTPSSTVALNFSKTVNGVIFRGAFPTFYTNKSPTKKGTKRSDEWYQNFADRFSGVFAEKASSEVYFVAPFDNNIRECSVWNRMELPTLQANADVTVITLVDYTDYTNTKAIWTPSSGFSETPESTSLATDTSTKYCYDWDGYGEDPNDPDGDDPDYVTYAAGWCGVHITQYQKNEGPGTSTTDYRFDVLLYDANGEQIGEADLLDIPSGSTASVDSALPYTFDITAGNVDSDAVLMAYAGQNWGSNDQPHQCNFGAYDSGNRDGDCGFTC